MSYTMSSFSSLGLKYCPLPLVDFIARLKETTFPLIKEAVTKAAPLVGTVGATWAASNASNMSFPSFSRYVSAPGAWTKVDEGLSHDGGNTLTVVMVIIGWAATWYEKWNTFLGGNHYVSIGLGVVIMILLAREAIKLAVKLGTLVCTILKAMCHGATVVYNAFWSACQAAASAVASIWNHMAAWFGRWKTVPAVVYSEPVSGVPAEPENNQVSLLGVDATLVCPAEGKPYFIMKRGNTTYRVPARTACTAETTPQPQKPTATIVREQKSFAMPIRLTRLNSWPQCAGYFYDLEIGEMFGHFNKVNIKCGRIDGNFMLTAHHVLNQYISRMKLGHSVSLVNPAKATSHFIGKSNDPEEQRRKGLAWARTAIIPFGADIARIPFECQDFKSAGIARRSSTTPEFYFKRGTDLLMVMPTKLHATNLPLYKLQDGSTDEGDSGCGGYESTGAKPMISYIHVGAHGGSTNNVCIDLTELYPSYTPPTVRTESHEVYSDDTKGHKSQWEDVDEDHISQIHGDPEADRSWVVDAEDRIGYLPNNVLSLKKSIRGSDGQYRNWADASEFEEQQERHRLDGDSFDEDGYKANREVYDPTFLEERSYDYGRRMTKRMKDIENSHTMAKYGVVRHEAVTATSTDSEVKQEIKDILAQNKVLGQRQAETGTQISELREELKKSTENQLTLIREAKENLMRIQEEKDALAEQLLIAQALQQQSEARVQTEREKACELARQLAEEKGKLIKAQQAPNPSHAEAAVQPKTPKTVHQLPAPQRPPTPPKPEPKAAPSLEFVGFVGGSRNASLPAPGPTVLVEGKGTHRIAVETTLAQQKGKGLPHVANGAIALEQHQHFSPQETDEMKARRKEALRVRAVRNTERLKALKAEEKQLKKEAADLKIQQQSAKQGPPAPTIRQEAVPLATCVPAPITGTLDAQMSVFHLAAPSIHDSQA